MKSWTAALAIATLLCAAPATRAQSARQGTGVGVIVGDPTGLSVKHWMGGGTAVDFGLGWSVRHDWLNVHADYLFHHYGLFPVTPGALPVYVGLGARLVAADDPGVGMRVPVGLDYQFAALPWDIFLELVPTLEVIPDTEFDLSGGIGARFFF